MLVLAAFCSKISSLRQCCFLQACRVPQHAADSLSRCRGQTLASCDEFCQSSLAETCAWTPRRGVLLAVLMASCCVGACSLGSASAVVPHGLLLSPDLADEQRLALADELYLLCMKSGLRPSGSGWTRDEKSRADDLVKALGDAKVPWRRSELIGTWKVAYLQGELDRRIPFPELPFNDSYEVFGESSVVNIGEILGPSVTVKVSGSLSEEDPEDLVAPKRFRANINAGAVDLGDGKVQIPLPISGLGIFDGIYLDSRLRIGLNLNG